MCFLPPAIIHGSEFNNLLVSQQSKVPCLPVWQPELSTLPISTKTVAVWGLGALVGMLTTETPWEWDTESSVGRQILQRQELVENECGSPGGPSGP